MGQTRVTAEEITQVEVRKRGAGRFTTRNRRAEPDCVYGHRAAASSEGVNLGRGTSMLHRGRSVKTESEVSQKSLRPCRREQQDLVQLVGTLGGKTLEGQEQGPALLVRCQVTCM